MWKKTVLGELNAPSRINDPPLFTIVHASRGTVSCNTSGSYAYVIVIIVELY